MLARLPMLLLLRTKVETTAAAMRNRALEHILHAAEIDSLTIERKQAQDSLAFIGSAIAIEFASLERAA